jgi:hypothetical protein
VNRERITARRAIFKAASIEFGRSAIECTVRNISDTGAALDVASPLYFPDRFTLAVHTDEMRRPCRVVWRRQRRIGVSFE